MTRRKKASNFEFNANYLKVMGYDIWDIACRLKVYNIEKVADAINEDMLNEVIEYLRKR